MTLFRVLSEEETKNVKRWQAPDLVAGAVRVADTRQQGKPQSTQTRKDVQPILGSRELQPGARLQRSLSQPATPDLQSVDLIDVFSAKQAVAQDARGANAEILPAEQLPAVTAKMLQSSYDQGYEEGFAKGQAALEQQSVNELQSVIKAISEASAEINDPQLEHEVLALTMDIARLVIRREITLQSDILLDIINAGMELLDTGSSKTRRIFLNPDDANQVRAHIPAESDLAIVDDPSMPRGGCRIESVTSSVDAGIEDWLQTVSAQLLE